jgi:tetratricopeptide (TPR) repeat protein
MLKTRIFLIVISVVLVVVLYALPKVVVDNKSEEVSSAEASAGTTENSQDPVAEAHGQSIAEEDASLIKQLRQSFKVAENKEKSIIFADSLATLYERSNLFDSAAMFIEEIAKRKPGIDIWRRAGNAYYEAFTFAVEPGKRREMGLKSEEYFVKVLEEEPGDLETKNRLAMTKLSTSNPMDGILMLRSIVEEDPENEKALFNLGALSMQTNQYDKAVERFEKVVELYPANIQAHFFLGVSYMETGKKKKAREQFELVKSMDADPEVQAAADGYLEEL